MASTKEYLDFVLEQLSELDEVSSRAMMGEYILYYRGKVFGGIYDDRLLVKPVPAALKLMPDVELELPYDGAKRIDKVKPSDAKMWLIKLQQKDGKSYSAIHSIRGVVRPAFQMAVDDDVLRKNPFGFQLATVLVNDAVTREAITRKQERTFLEFVRNDPHYSRYYDREFP